MGRKQTQEDAIDTQAVAVIPAFNAESGLPLVLSKLKEFLPISSVVVVDDGSHDSTAAVAGRYGCPVLRHPVNLGKGRALRSGFATAISMGAELVFTLDADGQHDPASLPDLWEAMRRHGFDIVIGSRRRDATMPVGRRLSNWLNSAVVTVITGQEVPDSQSGFRLIRSDVLKAVSLRGERYELETELLLAAAAHGFRIGSVTIPTIYAGQQSYVRPSDALRFVRLYLSQVRSR